MDTGSRETKYAKALRERQMYVDAVTQAATNKKIVVAGPGTGKTHLFKAVLAAKTNTLTLTFVNALVVDLSLELYGLSDVKTLHGFARRQLEKATEKTVRVFSKLPEVIKQDARALLDRDIDFDQLFYNRADGNEDLDFYKKRREYYGHYGFSDLIHALVLYLEQHHDKIPVYSQVVVDEFQDFNTLEVSLIDLLAEKSPMLLAGDDDQALYESLKCASARHIRARHGESGLGYTSFPLPFCSRCTRVIVDAANDIISRATENGHLRGRIPKPFRYLENVSRDNDSSCNPYLVYARLHARQIPWFIQQRLKDITKEIRNRFTVLILSPTRIQCRDIADALKRKGFQNVEFVENRESAEPSMLDGLKLLLSDKDCNLGWRVVAEKLLDEAKFHALLRETDKAGESRSLSGMVGLDVKQQVGRTLTALRHIRDGKDGGELTALLPQINIDPFALATDSLKDDLIASTFRPVDPGIRRTSIRVTTIQSAKGLAADYVFITHVDDRYCVKDRDKGKLSDQDICSFLVALTRAQKRVFLLSTDECGVPTFLKWIDPARLHEMKTARNTQE